MRYARRPIALASGAALAALALWNGPTPALAQGATLHFGAPAAEDRLVGGSAEPVRDGQFGRAAPLPSAWHRSQAARAAARYASPSVVTYRAPAGSTYFRGTGVYANAQGRGGGSVLVLPSRSQEREAGGAASKVIDVAAHRLDHRPVGQGGLSIQYVGSAKIIRVAPGYGTRRAEGPETGDKDLAALPEPAGPPVHTPPAPAASLPRPPVPTPAPAERSVAREPDGAPFLEPWTDDWLRDCVARHEDFDAALGTYQGADGMRRFCTGEAG